MFNRFVRAAKPIPHALPHRQAVIASFRSRVKSLPLAPQSLLELCESLHSGFDFTATEDARVHALADLRRRLFHAPGRESEGRALWREALATSAFAAHLAAEQGAAVSVAAAGGLLHRAGDAFAQKCMALAEFEFGVRMDSPSKSEMCATHGREIAERLVREWELPAAVGVCVVGWRCFGEFASVSPEAGAVYIGHVLAGELLHPYLTASGALEAACSELGMSPATLSNARAKTAEIRERVCALE